MDNKEFIQNHPIELSLPLKEAIALRKIIIEANRDYVLEVEETLGVKVGNLQFFDFKIHSPVIGFANAYFHFGILYTQKVLPIWNRRHFNKKDCSKCKKQKLFSEFHEKSSHCKTCQYEYDKEWKLKNPKKVKEYSDKYFKSYYLKNKEARDLYQKEYLIENREKVNKSKKVRYDKNKAEADKWVKDFLKKKNGF